MWIDIHVIHNMYFLTCNTCVLEHILYKCTTSGNVVYHCSYMIFLNPHFYKTLDPIGSILLCVLNPLPKILWRTPPWHCYMLIVSDFGSILGKRLMTCEVWHTCHTSKARLDWGPWTLTRKHIIPDHASVWLCSTVQVKPVFMFSYFVWFKSFV